MHKIKYEISSNHINHKQDGASPLHVAIRHGNIEMVSFFVEHKCSLSVADNVILYHSISYISSVVEHLYIVCADH